MTKKIAIIILMTVLSYSVNAQYRYSCTRYPDSTTLLQKLAFKPVGIDMADICVRCNITDTIKKRLLHLLIPGWTEDEIQVYVRRRLTTSYYQSIIYDNAKKVAKGNDSIYKKTVDNLVRFYGKSERKLLSDDHFYGVDGSILKTAALLNMKEAIPLIKKYFNYYNRGKYPPSIG